MCVPKALHKMLNMGESFSQIQFGVLKPLQFDLIENIEDNRT